MEILKFPHPDLFKKCDKITVFGPELKILLDSMWETMKLANGIGLAANQVSIPFRMFVMEGPNGRINLINPRIQALSQVSANLKEGCLSAPGESLVVPGRMRWVDVEYQDENGDFKRVVLHAIHAVCVQHEIEHLDGKSFMKNKTIHKTIRNQLSKKWKLK